MGQQDRFDRAVEALHEAAPGDARWPETSTLIDVACGWKGSHLVILDRHTRGRPEWCFDQFYYHGDSAEELGQEYISDFYPRDERIPRIMALPDRRLVRVTDLLTGSERETSAAYNDLLRRAVGQEGFNVRMEGRMGWTSPWESQTPSIRVAGAAPTSRPSSACFPTSASSCASGTR